MSLPNPTSPDSIARIQVRVPADTGGQDQRFAEAGFRFEPLAGEDAIYRQATLPRGWRARGLHPLQPLEIVDTHTRIRVLITYGTRAVLQRSGRTGLQPTARMRLVPLREYLARTIATGEPVIPDAKWCTPQLIWDTASSEALRATRIAAEFALRQQETSSDRYKAVAQRWTDLANQYAPTLLESAA